MGQPTDFYSQLAMVPQVNPAASFQQGQQVGMGLLETHAYGQEQQQRQAARQQVLEQARAKAIADAQAAVRLQEDRDELLADVNEESMQRFFVKHPEMAKDLEKVHERLAPREQEERLRQASQVYSALRGGAPDVAIQIANEYATAYDNAGRKQDAQHLRALAKGIERDERAGLLAVGSYLVVNGGEKYGKALAELESVDAEVGKAEAGADKAVADADIAEEEARYAAEKVLTDIEKVRADSEKARADARRSDAQNQTERDRLEFDKDEAKKKPKGDKIEAATVTAIADLDTQIGLLQGVITKKPSVNTGVAANTRNAIAQFFGIDDSKVTGFKAEVANINNEIINRLAGANVPASEFGRIKEGLPQADDDDTAFVAKLQATLARVKDARKNLIATAAATGRDTSRIPEVPEPPDEKAAAKKRNAGRFGGGGG